MTEVPRLEPDKLSYLQRVVDHIDNPEPFTDFDLLVENVLEELSTCYLSAICSKESSVLIEKLINFSDESFTIKLALDLVGFSWTSIITNPYASHVFDSALKVISKSSIDQERVTELVEWFINSANWETLVGSQYASQSLKHLIECVNEFKTLLELKIKLRHEILNNINLNDAIMTTFGSSLIQFLLLDSYHNDSFDHEVKPPKGEDPSLRVVKHSDEWEEGNGSVDFQIVFRQLSSDEERFETYVRNQGASRLVELVILLAPITDFVTLWTTYFRTKLMSKINHPVANFVVQRLIEYCRNEGQFKLIIHELGEMIEKLIDDGRAGVVVKLIETGLKFTSVQKALLAHLVKGLSRGNDVNETRKNIASILLNLKNTPKHVFKKSKSKQQKEEGISYLGCQILLSLLKYQPQYTNFIIVSLTNLPEETLIDLCKDKNGSRVMEVFFQQSTVPNKFKQTFVNKFIKGKQFKELAKDISGSYVVEKCYNAADVNKKESILLQILDIEDELKELRHGKFILNKLKVNQYKEKKENWRKNEESIEKKKEIFSDLLEEMNKATQTLKKRKRGEEEEKESKSSKKSKN